MVQSLNYRFHSVIYYIINREFKHYTAKYFYNYSWYYINDNNFYKIDDNQTHDNFYYIILYKI